MEFILFSILSIFEGFAIFYFTLRVFRFKIEHYVSKTLIICALESVLSYLLRDGDITWLNPLASLIAMVLYFVFVIRTRLALSITMTVVGFVSITIIQAVVLLIMNGFGVLDLRETGMPTPSMYALEVIASVLYVLLGYWLYRRGYGFTFEQLHGWTFRGEDVFMIVLTSLLIVGVACIVLLMHLLWSAAVVLALLLALLLWYGVKRELAGDR